MLKQEHQQQHSTKILKRKVMSTDFYFATPLAVYVKIHEIFHRRINTKEAFGNCTKPNKYVTEELGHHFGLFLLFS